MDTGCGLLGEKASKRYGYTTGGQDMASAGASPISAVDLKLLHHYIINETSVQFVYLHILNQYIF